MCIPEAESVTRFWIGSRADYDKKVCLMPPAAGGSNANPDLPDTKPASNWKF